MSSRYVAVASQVICAALLVAASLMAQNQSGASQQHISPIQLPSACSQSDIAKYGRPVMYQLGKGLSFGISTTQPEVQQGQPLEINVWLLNQSSSDFGYGLCCESTFLDWIEVYDTNQKKLVSAPGRTAQERDTVRGCACSEEIRPRHPGFCGVIDGGTLNRKDTAYDLLPGSYTVVGVWHGLGSIVIPDRQSTTYGLNISISAAQ